MRARSVFFALALLVRAATALPLPEDDASVIATGVQPATPLPPNTPAEQQQQQQPSQLPSEARLQAASRAWQLAASQVQALRSNPRAIGYIDARARLAAASREVDAARVAYLSDPAAPSAVQMYLVEYMRGEEETHVRDTAAALAEAQARVKAVTGGEEARRKVEREVAWRERRADMAAKRLVTVRVFKARICTLNPGWTACNEGGG
ncbi:MAG: hypothetical protein M1829_003344 [Trizodia sp. TS-e1964]|nr:MAG: hypothetical protein M1829_003344 [Trizodia sp. TS-e1964]